MKNIYRTIAVCLLTAAVSLTGVSCKKQEQAAPSPPPTPEQKAMIEVVKKNAEESKKVFAARVNGVDIAAFELVREMNNIAPKYVKGDEPIAPAVKAKIKKEALNKLIFTELAVQEAMRQGIKISPERIDNVIGLMKKQEGSAEAYQQYLDGLGITEIELRKRIERSHLLETITANVIYSKIKVDEKDIRAEYEKNKSLIKDRSGRQMTYEEAANSIKRKLTADVGAEKMKEWEKALRRNAKIVIAKDGGK